MKSLRNLIREEVQRVLSEIGGEDPFSFKRENVNVWEVSGDPESSHAPNEDRLIDFKGRYIFETKNGTKHVVKFEQLKQDHPELERVIEIGFVSKDHPSTFSDSKPLTGDYEARRVIITVIEIAKDLYEEYGNLIEGFAFSGWTKSDLDSNEMHSIHSQRSKIYKYLLKKRIPGVDIETIEDEENKKYLYVKV